MSNKKLIQISLFRLKLNYFFNFFFDFQLNLDFFSSKKLLLENYQCVLFYLDYKKIFQEPKNEFFIFL